MTLSKVNKTNSMASHFNFSNWAIVGLNDDTGLGRMVRDARKILDIGHHLIIESERFFTRPITDERDSLFDVNATSDTLCKIIKSYEGLFFIEQYYHPEILKIARGIGLKTLCIPMWEWFKSDDPQWQYCDLFVCPNQHCYRILQDLGYKNTIVLPTPLDLEQLPERRVKGKASLFIHNAGWVDWNDRKGTREVILAFQRMKYKDSRLIVRMQKEAELPPVDKDRIEIRIGNLLHPADLYTEGDVAVQPSKMEGIGFMVLEPVCCGLPVLTLDYGPMNEYVQHPQMLVCKRPFKRRAFATTWMKQAHLRLPSIRDLTRALDWCASNELGGISTFNRKWAVETFDQDKVISQWNDSVGESLRRRQ